MRRLFVLLMGIVVTPLWAEEPVDGNATIRAQAGKSEIVITTTSRLAGAIHSLTWDGMEFIDSVDHGRQLQSASNFDTGKRLLPETYNPTEAGSRRDGAGPKSSSKLLKLSAKGNVLKTTSQMAFWLAPGEKSGEHPAYNTSVLSEHLLSKRVEIGVEGMPQAISYDVIFHLPKNEQHHHGVFEVVTGYMPAKFNTFWRYDLREGKLVPLSDGPGEQSEPVVLATQDGRHAMGVFSAGLPQPQFKHLGYGRFRFKAEKVVKWNCVYRFGDPERIKTGDYKFSAMVLIGTKDDVEGMLKKLSPHVP